jgi:hypothetical protein
MRFDQPLESALRRETSINEHESSALEVCDRGTLIQKDVRNPKNPLFFSPQ